MKTTIDLSMKDFFFDRAKVLDQMERKNHRVLVRAGSFIRTRAKTRILKRRKGTSLPGRPPNVHAKSGTFATLKNILFAYDKTEESVVVGPVKLNQVERNLGGITTVPERLEKGGIGIIEEERFMNSNRWRRRDNRRNSSRDKIYRKRRARYRARPFMAPALREEVESGTIIGLFAKVQ